MHRLLGPFGRDEIVNGGTHPCGRGLAAERRDGGAWTGQGGTNNNRHRRNPRDHTGTWRCAHDETTGKAGTARDGAADSGQTMLVVLRIALVRTDIGVFLNDPGPRLAGSIEKDAFTSLLCSSPDR